MKKCAIFLIFIVVFIAGQTSVSAQTTYSLYDLCHLANSQAERISIAKEDVYIARQDKERAMSVLFPRLTAFASHTEYDDDSMNAPDAMVKGIKFTQSFTLNGKELIALDVTKRSIEQKEFALSSIRAEYFMQISQIYFQILSAQRHLEIVESDLDRLEKHRNAVHEKVNVGSLTKTALYRAEAELSSSRTQRVKAQNGIDHARAALKNMVRVNDDFMVSKDEILEINQFKCSLEDIKQQALSRRPEIKEAEKQIDIAQKTVKYEKSDYWPRINLEGAYKDTRIEYGMNHTTIRNDSENFSVTGEIVFTLYDGGLRKGTIQQALANERNARNALSILERKIILESEAAYLEFETAKSVLITLADELKAAEENFNAVTMQFEYGMADSIDMMDANTLLVTAQRKISDARYSHTLSVLNIIYTQGDLVPFLLKNTTAL